MMQQLARAEHRCTERLQINSHTALAQVTCHFSREGWMDEWLDGELRGKLHKKYSGTFLNRPLICSSSSLTHTFILHVRLC